MRKRSLPTKRTKEELVRSIEQEGTLEHQTDYNTKYYRAFGQSWKLSYGPSWSGKEHRAGRRKWCSVEVIIDGTSV
jgi:hypothetical protein